MTTAPLSALPPGGQLPAPVLAGGINDELLAVADEHRPRFGVLLALPAAQRDWGLDACRPRP